MEQINFKGLRNDKGKKFIGAEYFNDIQNFNFDNLIGANKIKFPSITYNGGGSSRGYGLFDYRFLDQNNVLKQESIAILGDSLYKNFHDGNLFLLASGLELGKATAKVYQDKLFIANGKNYPKIYDGSVVYEMGAPKVEDALTTGNLNGTYFYELTYVDAGGEKRLGTVSNTVSVSNSKVKVTLPIGYAGVTDRKLYRTEAGGTQTKLVTAIGDNTTLVYEDDVADGSLTTAIIPVNNECPKPYFLEVSEDRLIGCKADLFPTQLFITDANIEIFDLSNATDISNQTGDNSPIQGMKIDYNQLIVGSLEEIYIVNVSSTASVRSTRSNIGMKDGYSVQRIPSSEGFPGGVVFVSTLNDVRLFSGNIEQPVATSLDNLNTTNWSQVIQGTFINDMKIADNIDSAFFDYKYHLVVDQKYYVFDIRLAAWTKYLIKTASYLSEAYVLGIYDDELYLAQKNADIIEKHYQETTYRGEEVVSFIKSPQMIASDAIKFFKDFLIYYKNLLNNKFTVTLTIDGNTDNNWIIDADFDTASFLEEDFNRNYFDTVSNAEDYKEINLNRYGRWIEFKVEPTEGLFFFRGFNLKVEQTPNKEIPV